MTAIGNDKPTPTVKISRGDAVRLYDLCSEFPEGCSITLDAGTYTFNKTIALPSNTTITGAGPTQTRIELAAGSNCHLFTNADLERGNTNIRVAGLYIFGNRLEQKKQAGQRALTYSCAFFFRRAQATFLEDLHFEEICQTAIQFNNCNTLFVKNVETRRLGWSGLGTTRASNLWIENIHVSAAGLESTHSAIHLDGGVGVSVIGAYVSYTTGNGIMLDSTNGPLTHCEIRNARVTACFRGVSLSGSPPEPIDKVLIQGEFAKNKEAGVMASNASNVHLANCYVHDNEKYGVLFQGRTGGNGCVVSSDCVIERNGIDIAELHASGDNWIFRPPVDQSSSEDEKINSRTLRRAGVIE